MGHDNNFIDGEVLFFAQLIGRQQQQLTDLIQHLLRLDPNNEELLGALVEMEEQACGTIKPPQGGKRITEEVLKEMSEEECRWHFR
jgi:hypothetical protein